MMIVFIDTETIPTINLELWIDLWYNTDRRKWIVDSHDHPDASHRSQFINAPSMQPDTINHFLSNQIVIVTQIAKPRDHKCSRKTLLKPGDVRECRDYWIIVTNIAVSDKSLPQALIQYDFILSLDKLIESMKSILKLPADATTVQVLLTAYISHSILDQLGLVEELLKNLNKYNLKTTFVYGAHSLLKKSSEVSVYELCHVTFQCFLSVCCVTSDVRFVNDVFFFECAHTTTVLILILKTTVSLVVYHTMLTLKHCVFNQ